MGDDTKTGKSGTPSPGPSLRSLGDFPGSRRARLADKTAGPPIVAVRNTAAASPIPAAGIALRNEAGHHAYCHTDITILDHQGSKVKAALELARSSTSTSTTGRRGPAPKRDETAARGLLPISWSRDNGSQGCGCSSDFGSDNVSSRGTYLSHRAAYSAGVW
jgi:hypothetical protein